MNVAGCSASSLNSQSIPPPQNLNNFCSSNGSFHYLQLLLICVCVDVNNTEQ